MSYGFLSSPFIWLLFYPSPPSSFLTCSLVNEVSLIQNETLDQKTTAWQLSRRSIEVLMLKENSLSRITVDPEICYGKPCVRGLRYPVATLLEYLAGGDTIEDLLAEFPDLEQENILACHEFSRQMLATKSTHLALA